jgi:tetratricopeptide (TPR) repeat protein
MDDAAFRRDRLIEAAKRETTSTCNVAEFASFASPTRWAVELVKAEAFRSLRERPGDPDAVDLAMQGWASTNGGFSKANFYSAIDYFERALRLDPELTQAQIGLAWMLIDRVTVFGGGSEAVDFARAEALLASALSREPNNARAHSVKGYLLSMRKQFNDALSEQDAAIEEDRNYAMAYGARGLTDILADERRRRFRRKRPRFV